MSNMPPNPMSTARFANARQLSLLLQETRSRTLALLEDYVLALGEDCKVPQGAELNPPLWELCHVAWFQDWWLSRNPQWKLGIQCLPTVQRSPSRLADSDWRLDSSLIAHERRWDIGLPDLKGTRWYLESSLNDNLALLEELDPEHATDSELYFFRLSVFHEQMHNEAAVFMAKMLNIPLRPEVSGYDQLATLLNSRQATEQLRLPAGQFQLGWTGSGFAFDNELPAQNVHLQAFEIDSRVVNWQQYLEFTQATCHPVPMGIEYKQGQWWNTWHVEPNPKSSTPLDMRAAASNVSWEDAQAYCAWAGRRLPSEMEWEYAAMWALQQANRQPKTPMTWGEVWEWTADTFLPYCADVSRFEMHPYQDYSKPWFVDRKVLKGGSWATSIHMKHPKYRNFFQPNRRDVLSGFRTCKL